MNCIPMDATMGPVNRVIPACVPWPRRGPARIATSNAANVTAAPTTAAASAVDGGPSEAWAAVNVTTVAIVPGPAANSTVARA